MSIFDFNHLNYLRAYKAPKQQQKKVAYFTKSIEIMFDMSKSSNLRRHRASRQQMVKLERKKLVTSFIVSGAIKEQQHLLFDTNPEHRNNPYYTIPTDIIPLIQSYYDGPDSDPQVFYGCTKLIHNQSKSIKSNSNNYEYIEEKSLFNTLHTPGSFIFITKQAMCIDFISMITTNNICRHSTIKISGMSKLTV